MSNHLSAWGSPRGTVIPSVLVWSTRRRVAEELWVPVHRGLGCNFGPCGARVWPRCPCSDGLVEEFGGGLELTRLVSAYAPYLQEAARRGAQRRAAQLGRCARPFPTVPLESGVFKKQIYLQRKPSPLLAQGVYMYRVTHVPSLAISNSGPVRHILIAQTVCVFLIVSVFK